MAEASESSRPRKRTADGDTPTPAVGQVRQQVCSMAQRVSASECTEHERRLARCGGGGPGPHAIRLAISVGALAAGVAAVDAWPARSVQAVRWCVADRTPPLLDHLTRCPEVQAARAVVLSGHSRSMPMGCHTRLAPAMPVWVFRFSCPHESSRGAARVRPVGRPSIGCALGLPAPPVLRAAGAARTAGPARRRSCAPPILRAAGPARCRCCAHRRSCAPPVLRAAGPARPQTRAPVPRDDS